MKLKARLRRLPLIGKAFMPKKFVPVVRLQGVISAGSSPIRGGGLNLNALRAPLERAFKLEAPAVALAINSPGGSPVQSALIGREVRRLSEKHERPVLAFVEDVAASGGYWLALSADEIFADASSIVGSIGVVTSSFGFSGLLERYDVERRLYTTGEHKAMLDPFKPTRDGDVAVLKEIQADLFETFKGLVRERRGSKLTAPDSELFTGRVWSGKRAVELGLIDGLGDLTRVIQQRFGEGYKPVVVNRPRGLFQRRLRVDGLAREFAGGLIEAAEERALYARHGL